MRKKKKRRCNQRYNHAQLPFQGVLGTFEAQRYRKSHFYREQLSSFVGNYERIAGVIKDVRRVKMYGRWMNKFLLENVSIVDKPEQPITEHLWIICEKGYLNRNHFTYGDTVVLQGAFYEYKKFDVYGNPLRNIGFRLETAWSEKEYQSRNGGERMCK